MTAGSGMRVVAATESTNSDLLAAARAGEPEGSWLRARLQTGGRGRSERTWASPEGNLYASTVVRLRPGDPPAPGLALVAACALHDVASVHAAPAVLVLKWPNDLLAGSAKLAGILLEREADAVIIGFGVNLVHHPRGLDRPATDLAALSGRAPDPDAMAGELATAVADGIARWRAHGFEGVRRRWLARAHPAGTAIATSVAGRPVTGSFDGLEPDGALRLREASGVTRIVRAGDVHLV